MLDAPIADKPFPIIGAPNPRPAPSPRPRRAPFPGFLVLNAPPSVPPKTPPTPGNKAFPTTAPITGSDFLIICTASFGIIFLIGCVTFLKALLNLPN